MNKFQANLEFHAETARGDTWFVLEAFDSMNKEAWYLELTKTSRKSPDWSFWGKYVDTISMT